MPACVAPKCYRTKRRRRGLSYKTLPGKCTTPNPWVMFMMRVSGRGLSRDEVSTQYAEWKRAWLEKNRRLSHAAAKAKMNATLCEEVAERGVFFAQKPAPRSWSLNVHLRRLTQPFVFMVPGCRKTRTIMKSRTTNRLKPRAWFTGDIVNAYLALLSTVNPDSNTCIFMHSAFYHKFTLTDQTSGDPDPKYANAPASVRRRLVQRWTQDLNTTDNVKIFIPINTTHNHWSLLVIDVGNKTVFSFDSLGYSLTNERKEMLGWIEAEHRAKKKTFVAKKWTSKRKTVPLQENDYDCGVFVCMFAAFLSSDKSITLSQQDIPKMRKRIAWSILHNQL